MAGPAVLYAQEAAPADSGPRGGVPPAAADSAPAPRTATDSLAPQRPAGGDTLPAVRVDTLPAAPGDTLPADSAASSADSLERLRREVRSARERLEEVRETLETVPQDDRLRRSPRGAVLRAFALPGWGQFYTGHRIRGLLYGTAEVGFATLGFLEQGKVNDLKRDVTTERLEFVEQAQTQNPDTTFSLEDSLALFAEFDRTPQGINLQNDLRARRKQREDYFTYAIFSVIFASIDAFVSAHLEPFEDASVDLRRREERWEMEVRVR